MPMYRQHRTEVIQPEDSSISYIGLTQGQYTIVDSSDMDALSHIGWVSVWKSHHGKFYVSGYIGNRKYISLHNFLMNPVKGMEVDHINRNPLDNRRCNLRVVTHAENCKNMTKRGSGSCLPRKFRKGIITKSWLKSHPEEVL